MPRSPFFTFYPCVSGEGMITLLVRMSITVHRFRMSWFRSWLIALFLWDDRRQVCLAHWNPTCSSIFCAQGAHGPQVEFEPGVSATKIFALRVQQTCNRSRKPRKDTRILCNTPSSAHIALVLWSNGCNEFSVLVLQGSTYLSQLSSGASLFLLHRRHYACRTSSSALT